MAEREIPAGPPPKLEPKQTSDGRIDHSFLPFGETLIHLQWLSPLIEGDTINIKPAQRILFLGAGPVEPVVFWNCLSPETRSTLGIVVTEPNQRGMEQIRERLVPLDGNFTYMQADADEVLGSGLQADWIFFNAAIHLLSAGQRPEVINKIYGALVKGGKTVIVSTFIKNWYRRGEVRLYADLMNQTDQLISKEEPELFEIIQRARKNSSSPIKEMWSSGEYLEMFRRQGFKEMFFSYDTPEVLMHVPYEGFFYIAQYEEWINGSHPVRALGEEVAEDEYQKRMDKVTLYQQRAIAEVFPKFHSYGETSPRNQMVAVLQKPA